MPLGCQIKMHKFVVTGRAGSQSWPAKVFNFEFAAHIWSHTATATVAAKACSRDMRSIAHTTEYGNLPDAAQQEVMKVLREPFSLMDPACPIPPSETITYEVERIALHD